MPRFGEPGAPKHGYGKKPEIKNLEFAAREHTGLALDTLVLICKSSKQPGAARVSAAKELLDRGWGKAKQSVDLSGTLNVTDFNDGQLNDTVRRELAAFLISGVEGDASEADSSKLN